MGTNYYLCKDDRRIHIGKSSAGWCFSLHVIPEEGINTLDDWISLWGQPGMQIEDEYGRVIDIENMERIITKRSFMQSFGTFDHTDDIAQPGPNGLVRFKIGNHCVAHGDGTWDCIEGDFS
jgi:hypothetical protein